MEFISLNGKNICTIIDEAKKRKGILMESKLFVAQKQKYQMDMILLHVSQRL